MLSVGREDHVGEFRKRMGRVNRTSKGNSSWDSISIDGTLIAQ